MAYRRRHGITRSATFVENNLSSSPPTSPRAAARFADDNHRRPDSTAAPTSVSIAAQAIHASAAHRDSSVSSAYAEPFPVSSSSSSPPDRRRDPAQDSVTYEYTSIKSLNDEPKHGFWGVLARKAKAMLDENGTLEDYDSRNHPQTLDSSGGAQPSQSRWSYERVRKSENPTLQKGSEAIKDFGGKIKNALEEGLTMVENRTADIIQETRKLQIRRKASSFHMHNLEPNVAGPNLSPMQTDQETQLKASRDVANAMAAKAKLLLRELKTVKADLAFAKERCAQLEEENKMLRDGRHKGGHHADDDLIRLQLETLLAEKARLAHENTVYARENRFLREIVEFHQLNMQDVVNLDEDIEDDTDADAEPYDFHRFSLSRPVQEVPLPALSAPQPPSPYPDQPLSPKTSSPVDAEPSRKNVADGWGDDDS